VGGAKGEAGLDGGIGNFGERQGKKIGVYVVRLGLRHRCSLLDRAGILKQ